MERRNWPICGFTEGNMFCILPKGHEPVAYPEHSASCGVLQFNNLCARIERRMRVIGKVIVREVDVLSSSLNLEAILTGDVNRLRYINRFSTALVAHRENVAEHSFYVAYYSLLLAMDARNRGHVVDIQSVLTKAIVHDVEEARTGDIYRPFKISNPALARLIHEGGQREMATIINATTSDLNFANELFLKWDYARDNSPEGCIVAFADYLGVLAHMLQELRVANMTMRDHYASMVEYTHEFDRECYDFLRPLIDEAAGMVRSLLGDKVDELERGGN